MYNKTLENKSAILLTAKLNEPQQKMPGRFYPQLNGLRFIFIFMVMLHHWGPETIFKEVRIGWLGVDLFFVLSGFLIGEILLLEKERTQNKLRAIKNFIIRRALRIFPLYYFTVILYSALITTGGILIWNITYTNNILQFINFSNVPEVFWHLWSLCVEEQFYIFFPFLVLFVARKTFLKIVIGGIVFSAVGRLILVSLGYGGLTYALMPFCLDSLFMGVLLAFLKTYHINFLEKLFSKKLLVYSAIILLPLAMFWVSIQNRTIIVFSSYRFLGSLLGFCMIGYSIIRSYTGLPKLFLENRFISLLGKISYGLYLLHPFVEEFYRKYFDNNPIKTYLLKFHLPIISNMFVIDFVFLFFLTSLLAYISFRFIEQRFLNLKVFFTG